MEKRKLLLGINKLNMTRFFSIFKKLYDIVRESGWLSTVLYITSKLLENYLIK
jgi:hypothetical protein